jgi:Transposase
MPNKRYKAEPIATLLRQIEVGIANGKTTPQVCKEAEITVQTYYRWRKEYGGAKAGSSKATEGIGEGERQAQASGGRAIAGETGPEGYCGGKRFIVGGIGDRTDFLYPGE